MSQSTYSPVFDVVFDVAVLGSGFAGFAAACQLKQQGLKVVLIGPRGDLLWEAGRAFHTEAGDSSHPLWQQMLSNLAEHMEVPPATTEGATWVDGALAEVWASQHVLAQKLDVLYYAHPVATQTREGCLEAILVATKTGLRRVIARQWIDATEEGQLLSLTDHSFKATQPTTYQATLFFQRANWDDLPQADQFQLTAWPTQRSLTIALPAADVQAGKWRKHVIASLDDLASQIGDAVGNMSVSHLTIEPIGVYSPADASLRKPSLRNVALACPALTSQEIDTLAQRFELGIEAAESLSKLIVHEPPANLIGQPIQTPAPYQTLTAEVGIAGLGTGGVVAALAARKVGASVLAIEPMTFTGGIGTGGGIHSYYYGVAGGLQHLLDQTTREFQIRYNRETGQGLLGDGRFNPWAKMIALEHLLEEYQVSIVYNALLFSVEMQGSKVTAALVATPQGVVRIQASAWVDGTGDGDLCELAGASFVLGREGDGLLHAYSQSSGILDDRTGRPRMGIVNYDAGFCDPTDTLDLTRARLVGISQYWRPLVYANNSRPTYIAPAIGLRQGRQIDTLYTLSLDDHLNYKRFDDAIGFTGCHYDNHATDYEFESDDAFFWVWVVRGWHKAYACDMPYGMIVPKGVDNVWIGSRCFGVSIDAHHSCRMQRDVQRAGEAAGFAAAIGAKHNVAADKLPYELLRPWLTETGALERSQRQYNPDMGYSMPFLDASDEALAAKKAEALAALEAGKPDPGIWWLYRHPQHVREDVRQRLNHENPLVSWLATGLLAMWNDPAAEAQLIQRIESLDYGYVDPNANVVPATGTTPPPKQPEPLTNNRLVPNWLSAVGLLRVCGSAACLPTLQKLVDKPVHGINTLTTLSLTLERLASRLDASYASQIEDMLTRMAQIRVVGTWDYSQRKAGAYSELAIRGQFDDPAKAPNVNPYARAEVDNTWQLHLAIARARKAWNLEPHAQALAYLSDSRALVRRAIAQAISPAPATSQRA